MADIGHKEGHEEKPAAEAIRFLIIAALALVVARAAHALGDWALAPDVADSVGQLAAQFRRGYLLPDPHVLVPEGSSAGARAGTAVIIGMAGGALGAFIGRLLGGAASTGKRRGWRLGLRLGLVSTTAWALLAALVWPPLTLRITHDQLSIRTRPSLGGILGAPWPTAEKHFAWGDCWIDQHHTKSGKPAIMLTAGAESVVIEASDDTTALGALHAFISDRVKRNDIPE
jgi:hypothetical protein